MIVYLNVSRASEGRNYLSASFHRVSQASTKLGKPYKKFTADPVTVVTKVIQELQNTRTPIRFFNFSPDLPQDVSSIMHQAIMAYLRTTLPVKRGLLKISTSHERTGNIVNVVHYSSIEEEQQDLEPVCFSGPLVEVANKVFKTLDEGYRHPVVLQFEGKVPKEVSELFALIVNAYNNQLP